MCEAIKIVSEHQRKQNDTIKKMFFGLLISVTLMVASICGTVLYIWYNSDIMVEETTTTTYDQDTGENGDIINGNQFNDSAQNVEGGGVDGKAKGD